MTPEQELKLDNLLHHLALFAVERQADRARQERIDAHLDAIERALAIPVNYSLREMASRLNVSASTIYHHPEEFPAPVSYKPLRYRVSDVEALALHGLPKMGRKGPRRGRKEEVKVS